MKLSLPWRRANPWPKGSPGYWLAEAQYRALTQGTRDQSLLLTMGLAASFAVALLLSLASYQINVLLWWLLLSSLVLIYATWAGRRYWPIAELNQWLADEEARLDAADRLPRISEGDSEGPDLRSAAIRARRRLFLQGDWTPSEWEAAARATDSARLRSYHLAHIGLMDVLVKYLEHGPWVAAASDARSQVGDLRFDRRAKILVMLARAAPVVVVLPILALLTVGIPLIGFVAPGFFPGSCGGEWLGDPPPWCTGDAAGYLLGQITLSVGVVAAVVLLTWWLVRVKDQPMG